MGGDKIVKNKDLTPDTIRASGGRAERLLQGGFPGALPAGPQRKSENSDGRCAKRKR